MPSALFILIQMSSIPHTRQDLDYSNNTPNIFLVDVIAVGPTKPSDISSLSDGHALSLGTSVTTRI